MIDKSIELKNDKNEMFRIQGDMIKLLSKYQSREISLAITNLQQAIMWAERYFNIEIRMDHY